MPSPCLPAAIIFVVGVAFALLTHRVAQSIGRSPVSFARSDTVHDFVGRGYRVAGGVLFAFLMLRSVWPEIDAVAGPIPALVRPAVA
jgi:hypothetical protein